jgi:polysaccharide export outer membrane protein
VVFSCKSYQANILFTVEEGDMEELSKVAVEVHQNYIVSPNDHLQIEVYTNKGEKLIDPDNALNVDQRTGNDNTLPVYTISSDGTVELPIIGYVELAGMSLGEVNGFLAEKYKEYYKDPFVLTRYLNKRVIVLGATEGKVVPLENEGMNVLEVLALAGGVNNDAKGSNIRLIRGDLNNPQVQVIDLSTIEGMARANLEVQPNDIIYIEPVRRPITEGLRDIVPVLSILTSVFALVVALSS